jgi:4-hydroxybenzoate polyprenyltransferase
MVKFQTVIKLFKIKNWIKNLLIIIPIFFSAIIPDRQMILELIILFFAFSLSASTIYIFNDIIDKNTDKLDLIKKNRPLASGLITIKDSILIIIILMAILIIYLISTKNNVLNIFIIFYFLTNIFYTCFLKKIFFLDVCTLSIFYILRVVAPIYYFNLTFSYWLISITFISVLTVGFGKRYMDINNNLSNKKFISLYTKKNLVYLITISATLLQTSYVFLLLTDYSISKYGENFYVTGIVFFLGILRYLHSLFKLNFKDPIEIFTKDRYFILIMLTYIFVSMASIYNFL